MDSFTEEALAQLDEWVDSLEESDKDALRQQLEAFKKMVFKMLNGKKKSVEADKDDDDLAESKDRKGWIAAIWKRMPTDSRGGRGDKRKIMYTGDLAKKMGVKNYSSAVLSKLSDDELSKIAKILGESDTTRVVPSAKNKAGKAPKDKNAKALLKGKGNEKGVGKATATAKLILSKRFGS